MSGGHFEYRQHALNDIADTLGGIVSRQEQGIPEYEGCEFEPMDRAVLDRLRGLEKALRVAYDAVHLADYLLSGDTGPDSFLKAAAKWPEWMRTGATRPKKGHRKGRKRA